jgi:hypothetical protein
MSDLYKLKTQISGKYSPDNLELFAFKKRVQETGAVVSYPAGDSIISYPQGFAITVPKEGEVPFHDTEVDFLVEIGKSDIQITYNRCGSRDGYLGESTAVETAWAMMLQKPVVLVGPITETSPDISPAVLEIVECHLDTATVLPLHTYDVSVLGEALHDVVAISTPQPLSQEHMTALHLEVARLLTKYSAAWSQFCSNRYTGPAA